MYIKVLCFRLSCLVGASCAAVVFATEVIKTIDSSAKDIFAEGNQSRYAHGSSMMLAPFTSGILIPIPPMPEQVTTPTNGEEASA